jgi:hypothetical protein
MKKYEMRKEVTMEYQIEDAERSGGSRWWCGFVNGQATKQGPKLWWNGWVGLFVKFLRNVGPYKSHTA